MQTPAGYLKILPTRSPALLDSLLAGHTPTAYLQGDGRQKVLHQQLPNPWILLSVGSACLVVLVYGSLLWRREYRPAPLPAADTPDSLYDEDGVLVIPHADPESPPSGDDAPPR